MDMVPLQLENALASLSAAGGGKEIPHIDATIHIIERLISADSQPDEAAHDLRTLREHVVNVGKLFLESHASVEKNAENALALFREFLVLTEKKHNIEHQVVVTREDEIVKLKRSMQEVTAISDGLNAKVASTAATVKELKAHREAWEAERASLLERIDILERARSEVLTEHSNFTEALRVSDAELTTLRFANQEFDKSNHQLRESFDVVVKEAGVRAKEEVAKIRILFDDKVSVMMQQAERLEAESAARQSQFERTTHEKEILERDLRVLQENCTKLQEDHVVQLTTINEKLSNQCSENRALVERIRHLDTELTKLRTSNEASAKVAHAEFRTLNDRLAKSKSEVDVMRKEKLAFLEREHLLDDVSRRKENERLQSIHQARTSASQVQAELTSLRADCEIQLNELKLQQSDAIRESDRLLQLQIAAVQRWKAQYEAALSNVQEEKSVRVADQKSFSNEVQNLRKLLDEAYKDRNRMMADLKALKSENHALRLSGNSSDSELIVEKGGVSFTDRRRQQLSLVDELKRQLDELGA